MLLEVGPCQSARFDLQLLNFVSNSLIAFVTLWLAHRRTVADAERKLFYRQMRDKHGLDHPEAEQQGRGKKKVRR